MIGTLNKKILLSLLCVPLMFSCGEKEDKKEEKNNEIGRYQVIEKKHNSHKDNDTYWHTYYLLDTKTGEIRLIDFPK